MLDVYIHGRSESTSCMHIFHKEFLHTHIQDARTHLFSIFPRKKAPPKSSQSKLRMEFSSSVCFIENGAGRKRNHFHRIRIIQEFFNSSSKRETKNITNHLISQTTNNREKRRRRKDNKELIDSCVCIYDSVLRNTLYSFFYVLRFELFLLTFLVAIAIQVNQKNKRK